MIVDESACAAGITLTLIVAKYVSGKIGILSRTQLKAHEHEVQLYAVDVLALDGDDLRGLSLSMRKTNLARLLARTPDGIFIGKARSARTCSAPPARWTLRARCRSGAVGLTAPAARRIGSR